MPHERPRVLLDAKSCASPHGGARRAARAGDDADREPLRAHGTVASRDDRPPVRAAILVDSERYLCELLRYIHLNPVRAGLVAEPAAYEWSGHRAYLGLASWTWLTTSLALGRFGNEPAAAREAYRRFVLDGIGTEPSPEYSRGRADDSRILGNDAFVARAAARSKATEVPSIDALISYFCRQYGADSAALSRSGRHRELVRLRALVVHHALDRRAASLSELARRFHRSPSTLSESLEHCRRQFPELFEQPLRLQITE